MAWQFPKKIQAKGIEEKFKEENIEREGKNEKNEGDNGLSSNDIKQGDDITKELEVSHSKRDVKTKEEGEDEEDEEFEEEVCKHEHQHNTIQNVESQASRIYKIIMGEWTCTIFYLMLEYFYTERCHVLCENVAALWKACTQILLQSLTDIIILHPINEYCHLALKNEANRRSLLTLANASYKSKVESSKLETL